jgi:hypothetical protein
MAVVGGMWFRGEFAIAARVATDLPRHDVRGQSASASASASTSAHAPLITPQRYSDAAHSWKPPERCMKCIPTHSLLSYCPLSVGSRLGTGESLRLPFHNEEVAFTA